MVWTAPKPIRGFPIVYPQVSDNFNSPRLNPKWQWNHQPRPGFWSLSARPGWLRLKVFKPLEPGKFFKVGNVILQRYFKSDHVTALTKIDFSGMADGEEGGLAHLDGGSHYATLGVVQKDTARTLKFELNGTVVAGPAITRPILYLRTDIDAKGMAIFAYSYDNLAYTPLGEPFPLTSGGYRGDGIGFYTFNPIGEHGHIDIDGFQYTFSGLPQTNR